MPTEDCCDINVTIEDPSSIDIVVEDPSVVSVTSNIEQSVVTIEDTQNIVVESDSENITVSIDTNPDNIVVENQSIISVTVQQTGAQGPPGISTQIYLNLLALENISALKVVTAGISIADKDTNPRAIGMAKNAINIGEEGLIVTDGIVQDPFFSFTVGQPIFLGTNGAVTQTPPTSGWLVTVGTALKTDTIKLELQSLKIQLL